MSETPDTPSTRELISGLVDYALADVHVAIPAIVETYDATRQAVSVQPAIRRAYDDEEGTRTVEQLPIITDVPVIFPGAAGYRMTMPIAQGDTVMLLFSEASMERWLTVAGRQGEGDPVDDRRFDLSDAVAIPGLRTFTDALSDAPTDRMSLGYDGGATVEFHQSEIRLGSNSASDGVIRGTTRDTAEQTFLTALNTAYAATLAPAGAKTAFANAVGAFKSSITSAISSKVKAE